mgnify:CR=1 FL=1
MKADHHLLGLFVSPEVTECCGPVAEKSFWQCEYIVILVHYICGATANAPGAMEVVNCPLDRLHLV